MSLNRNNNIIITNELAQGKPELTPKPKLLENLEMFLKRELKLLGSYGDHSEPCEARLQVREEERNSSYEPQI